MIISLFKVAHKRRLKISKITVIGVSVGIVVVIIAIILIQPILTKPDYRLEVDAMKVNDLVQISNVRVTNTGKLALTELAIDFGEGDVQFFKNLESGYTLWVSPRAQNLGTVTVTSKEGIHIVKDFRQPMSMVAFGPS